MRPNHERRGRMKILIFSVALLLSSVAWADEMIRTDEGNIMVLDIGDGDKIITGDVHGVVLNLDSE